MSVEVTPRTADVTPDRAPRTPEGTPVARPDDPPRETPITPASADVTREFDAGAPRYDLLVGLNPGYHQHLRAAAAALADRVPAPRRLLDLGCGSGASTKALLSVFGDGVEIRGVDASAGMLAQARGKTWPPGVSFTQGRAGALDDLLAEPVDGMLAAYLFRNVPEADRDAALADAWAALRPGGALVVVEYSVAGDARAGRIWRAICEAVILPLATVTGGNHGLYRYLERSVLDFDTVPRFAARLGGAGFVDVESRTVTGWQRGILHVIRATRPLDEPAPTRNGSRRNRRGRR
ncbi:MAG: class I SAM-dependent methyltransferase [Micropruina sp.]|nr:class I SAM-dependent methyltransferase [Micropruina sp.]